MPEHEVPQYKHLFSMYLMPEHEVLQYKNPISIYLIPQYEVLQYKNIPKNKVNLLAILNSLSCNTKKK